MAPTICSDKKRPIRSGINHMRRNARSTHLNNPASTIINYVAKGSLAAAALRIRSADREQLEQSSSSSSTIGNINSATPQQQQSRQISDDIVSSSTNVDVDDNPDNTMTSNGNLDASSTRSSSPSSTPGSSICGSPYQYSDETMDDDDADDAEVHSITSGKRSHNDNANDNANDCDVDVDEEDIEVDAGKRQQLVRSTLETVFNAPTLSDKLIRPNSFNIHNNNNAKSYSNMCEITNTEGLLAIAIKTIKLVKRNQMLQRRLAQLQQETSEFIQSVLANPENRHFREKMQQKGQKLDKI